jgi:hypothetical protein
MYSPEVKHLTNKLNVMSQEKRDKLIDSTIKDIKDIESGSFSFAGGKNIDNPVRFWKEEHKFVVSKYRPNEKWKL